MDGTLRSCAISLLHSAPANVSSPPIPLKKSDGGRFNSFIQGRPNDGSRRVSPIAVGPGDGRLSDPRAGAQLAWRELVFLPIWVIHRPPSGSNRQSRPVFDPSGERGTALNSPGTSRERLGRGRRRPGARRDRLRRSVRRPRHCAGTAIRGAAHRADLEMVIGIRLYLHLDRRAAGGRVLRYRRLFWSDLGVYSCNGRPTATAERILVDAALEDATRPKSIKLDDRGKTNARPDRTYRERLCEG